MSAKDILKDVVARRCYSYREEPFTLASGRKSNYYFNLKIVTLDPYLLFGIIVSVMLEDLKDKWGYSGYFKAVGGMTTGADPLVYAVASSRKMYPLIVRKEAKEHGAGGSIVGLTDKVEHEELLCLEDVTTTGASALRAVRAFRNAHIKCNVVLTLLDREEGAEEAMREENVELISVFRKSDITGEV